jgi:hypothetical protein
LRLFASAVGDGWDARLENALVTPRPGATVAVPVTLTRGTRRGEVTLTAVSESDDTQRATATCTPPGDPSAPPTGIAALTANSIKFIDKVGFTPWTVGG